jgi:hypothetical protein
MFRRNHSGKSVQAWLALASAAGPVHAQDARVDSRSAGTAPSKLSAADATPAQIESSSSRLSAPPMNPQPTTSSTGVEPF